MSINLRCTRTNCRKRLSISTSRKHIPNCPTCGGHMFIDPEPQRRSRRQVCHCSGLPFPHRKSSRGCFSGPELSESDFRSLIRHLQRSHT